MTGIGPKVSLVKAESVESSPKKQGSPAKPAKEEEGEWVTSGKSKKAKGKAPKAKEVCSHGPSLHT